jgi:hypothetical protein
MMIVPRQVVVPHALASCSNNCQSPTPNPVSLQNSALSTAVLRPEDVVAKEELKREAERQTLFQKVSNEILDIPSGYRKVEVLIIRWDESVDEFKGHDGEVRICRRQEVCQLLTIQHRSKDFKQYSDLALATVVRLLGSKRVETLKST